MEEEKTTPGLATRVVATLRAHEPALRRFGVRRVALFGSVARGEERSGSDIDLAIEFDREAGMDLVDLVAMERRLGEMLGRRVEILAEPIENPRLRKNVERDRLHAF